MEDMVSASAETTAVEWHWMEASVQDEVSVRAAEEASRKFAEAAQAKAEQDAAVATAERNQALAAGERDQRARLMAEEDARAAREETETWRSTAMAGGSSRRSNGTFSSNLPMNGLHGTLIIDEAQAHAAVVEYDTVMEKLERLQQRTLSPQDASVGTE